LDGYTLALNSSSIPGSQIAVVTSGVSPDQTGFDLINTVFGKVKRTGATSKNSSAKTAISATQGRFKQSFTKETNKAITPSISRNNGSISNNLNMAGIIINIRLLLD
jgi:type IV secretory pathway TrbL component